MGVLLHETMVPIFATHTQAEEEFERERQELKEKALEQQKQAVQREEELQDIIKQLKSELAKVCAHTHINTELELAESIMACLCIAKITFTRSDVIYTAKQCIARKHRHGQITSAAS